MYSFLRLSAVDQGKTGKRKNEKKKLGACHEIVSTKKEAKNNSFLNVPAPEETKHPTRSRT
jgi:hypothetical protein